MRPRRRTTTAATVLRSVLDNGPVARSTIARLTGLSAAAVTRQYAELADLGLLREVAEARVPRVTVGRPHVPVDIDVARYAVCGVHIALSHTTLSLVDLRGRVLSRSREPHPGPDPAAVFGQVRRRLPGFLRDHLGERTALGLGLAIGGWVDPERGTVVRHSQLGWRDVPAREALEPLGLPVHVESHSRALARAEQLFGDQRSRSSVVHLFVGNVVDAAIATAGAVHHGPRSAAGNVAHLRLDGSTADCPCGRRGCFQATVSDRAVAERAARAGLIPEPSLPLLVDRARAGDGRARDVLRERARHVGQAVGLLLDLVNPEVLVLAEAGVVHLPECLDEVRAQVGDRAGAVAPTSFGPDVLSVAAGSVVLDAIYGSPLDLCA
ncbi:ROK family transcriptional regulator [Saccharothrix algeriensis]|uniref:NBD/HSP70 family sugar kinase n=1 Tax=Saccharothrix algeriensis TaxID=173560 RepID=A0A8T8I110_9PSEU|nr:ROK family transcriptional regulator [Saccharothrix algeriensis]MBM7810169.1 putative NBD/HSP70 family sugar kinase [Saccharothrix algeriensis]QTR04357.1 ROK family protein [Saccharothrix algeriensis]